MIEAPSTVAHASIIVAAAGIIIALVWLLIKGAVVHGVIVWIAHKINQRRLRKHRAKMEKQDEVR